MHIKTRSMFRRGVPQKHRYQEPETGTCLAGGGIVFFNSEGMYLLRERAYSRKKKQHLTDFGGKYESDDIDIYQTISRELSEETYHTINITREAIRFMYHSRERVIRVYINGQSNSYVTLFIHIDLLPVALYEMLLPKESISFLDIRKQSLKNNPHVSGHHYRSLSLVYRTYDEIQEEFKKNDSELSMRLLKTLESNTNLIEKLKDI